MNAADGERLLQQERDALLVAQIAATLMAGAWMSPTALDDRKTRDRMVRDAMHGAIADAADILRLARKQAKQGVKAKAE